MSDCANSRMEPYDATELRVYFFGQHKPMVYPIALDGRVVNDVFVGGKHYVQERTCTVPSGYLDWPACSECGMTCGKGDNYCRHCGAKVV